jgi:hypothetical protein
MSSHEVKAGAVAAVDPFAIVDQLIARWPFVVDGATETLSPDTNATVVAIWHAAAARIALAQSCDA